MKFGRLFQVFAQGKLQDHRIASPLTCRFQVINNSLFSCGSAVIYLYNLSPDVRNDLFKDAYAILQYKQVALSAGYQKDSAISGGGGVTLPVIFQGNITQAFSYRQGPDWITEIQAMDGGYALENGSINLTKPSGYSFEDVMADVVLAMPNVKLNLIGAFDVDNARGITLCGNPWDCIVRAVRPYLGQAFIAQEKVSIIQQWEYLEDAGALSEISPETGLIGTPKLQSGLVCARMIFEPRLRVAQIIKLATLESRMNGDYKILSLVHRGTVSGAVCDTLETEATLYQPERTLEAA